MFKILQKSISVGTATVDYPRIAPRLAEQFRGCPQFDFAACSDARPAADACPTGAIALSDLDGVRQVTVDYGRCIFCGECERASADGAVRMTRHFELAATDRRDLILTAEYALHPDGCHAGLRSASSGPSTEEPGKRTAAAIHNLLGRSLAIRQVDAGSCNGCEQEIAALNNPVHDIERFGIHFVASPRHADMLLVTRPCNSQHGTGIAQDLGRDASPESCRSRGRMRHQWRHLRNKLRIAWRSGCSHPCRRLHSRLSSSP